MINKLKGSNPRRVKKLQHCCYCRNPLSRRASITVDHVICRGWGVHTTSRETSFSWNKVVCCRGCNRFKSKIESRIINYLYPADKPPGKERDPEKFFQVLLENYQKNFYIFHNHQEKGEFARYLPKMRKAMEHWRDSKLSKRG